MGTESLVKSNGVGADILAVKKLERNREATRVQGKRKEGFACTPIREKENIDGDVLNKLKPYKVSGDSTLKFARLLTQ